MEEMIKWLIIVLIIATQLGWYDTTPKPLEPEEITPPAVVESTQPTEPVFDGSTPNSDILRQMQNDPDLLGVLYIPAVNMSPTYLYVPHKSSDLQSLADLKNSGYCLALYDYYNTDTRRIEIGDHNNQNFQVNTEIEVGDIGYINRGDHVITIKCISKTANGSIAEYDQSIVDDDNIIATLTCAPGGTRTIHRWVIEGGIDFDTLWEEAGKHYKGQRNSP